MSFTSKQVSLLLLCVKHSGGKVNYEKAAAEYSGLFSDDPVTAKAICQRVKRVQAKLFVETPKESKRRVKRKVENENPVEIPSTTPKKIKMKQEE